MAQETPWVLVEEGIPKATLVLGAVASETEQHAAKTLQYYIAQMSGATLPIRRDNEPLRGYLISIGKTRWTDHLTWPVKSTFPWRDGFLIRTIEAALILLGERDEGTRHAVYALLEDELGIGFFAGDPSTITVPTQKTIRLRPIDRIESPSFPIRSFSPNTPETWTESSKLGGMPHWFSHAFLHHFPPDRYYHDHPEYYALVEGKRIERGQICTSNPELIGETLAKANAYFDANPEALTFSLSPEDFYGWCECATCKAQDPPDQRDNKNDWKARRILLFANAVARGLQETHPGKLVGFYAYEAALDGGGTLKPPTDVEAEPNVIVIPCHFHYCYAHSIFHQDCKANTTFRTYLEGWQMAADHFILYEYYFWSITPHPVIHTVAQDLKGLHHMGYLGIYGGVSNNAECADLFRYVVSRLLWNVNQDVETLIERYCQGVYGAAAEPMQQYYNLLEETVQKTTQRVSHGMPVSLFTTAVLKECDQYLEQAEQLAPDDVRRRVAISKAHMQFVRLYQEYLRRVRTFYENSIADTTVQTAQASQRLLDHIESVAELNPTWHKAATHEIGQDLQTWIDLARFVQGVRKDRFWWRQQFDKGSALQRVKAYHNVRWADSPTSNFYRTGYLTADGEDAYIEWQITIPKGYLYGRLITYSFDYVDQIAYFDVLISKDQGQSWIQAARVDNDKWCYALFDISEMIRDQLGIYLRVRFPDYSDYHVMLAELTLVLGNSPDQLL